MANAKNLKPFAKGDSRINRKGRPRNFDALRTLAQDIAHEEARTADGQALTVNGKTATITEAILRKWATSKDPRLQIMFMEVCYGKVPTVTELTGKDGGPIRSEQSVKPDLSKLTVDELLQLRTMVAKATDAATDIK